MCLLIWTVFSGERCGPWASCLKTLTLLITFEQLVLELWYFTWVFLVIRPFSRYHYFLQCDFDLVVCPIFGRTLSLLITFEPWVLELWYFTWVFLVIRPFRWYHYFWPVTLTLKWEIYFKNLILLIIFE